MRVAFLSQPMVGTGGAEKVVARLSFALSDQFDFIFGCPLMSLPDQYKIPYQGKLVEIDVQWNVVTKNISHRGLKIVHRLRELIRFTRQEDPDIILSNSIFVWHHLIIIIKLLRLTRKKVILRFGNYVTAELNKRSRLYVLLLRMGAHRAEKVLAASQGVAAELQAAFALPPDKIKIINNPIPITEIGELSSEVVRERPFHEQLPIILNVSRLAYQKNLPLLIRAFRKVREHVDANLVLVGAGPSEAELRQLVQDLALEERVFFLGWQQNPFKFMRLADVFVLSSDYEGFCNVIVEAMVCGCPIIATDCPHGPAEILQEGEFGLLVPVRDEAALVREMLRLLSDDSLRSELARKGRQRANDFNVATMAGQYARLFRELAGAV